jgi:hypothetical protein
VAGHLRVELLAVPVVLPSGLGESLLPGRLGGGVLRLGLFERLLRLGQQLLVSGLAAEHLAQGIRLGRGEPAPVRRPQRHADVTRRELGVAGLLLQPFEIDVVVDVQRRLQQGVELVQLGLQVRVGRRHPGRPGLDVEPLAFPLVRLGRPLGGPSGGLGLPEHLLVLLVRGGLRSLLGVHLLRMCPLHLLHDAHVRPRSALEHRSPRWPVRSLPPR